MATENRRPTRFNRRAMLLGGTSVIAATGLISGARAQGTNQGQPVARPEAGGNKPNILVIMGDDIGQTNISAYAFGVVGYKTPNIDRIAKRRHDVHRLLRREQLHGGPLVVHHRPNAEAHRAVQGRHSRRSDRAAGP